MKTFEEHFAEVSLENNLNSFEVFREVAHRLAREVAEDVRRRASENAAYFME
jgi:hypothetical protein